MINGNIKSDFLRFFYIDEFYHNIGMQIRPNLTDFVEKMSSLGGFTDKSDEFDLSSSSILKILSITAQDAGCALLTLPTMLGLGKTYATNDNLIGDVFRAYPFNESVKTRDIETSFVILYSNQKSSVLSVESQDGKNAYKSDGFDIADTWGEIVPQAMLTDDGENGYVVPCFGVTFAKQNQSYFKNIRLSMNDHQITEYSVRNEVMISYANNRGPRETTILGQDLYSVFANYSYSCSVEMLGDVQITPLMYFQLNNIAMWKGAYLITSVQHTIDAHGMTTNFTGVRQARPSVPFKSNKIPEAASDENKQTPQSEETEIVAPPERQKYDFSERPLDKVNVDDAKGIIFKLDRTTLTTSNKWINGLLSVTVYYNDDRKPETFDTVAYTIEPTNGLIGRIEDYTPGDNNLLDSVPTGRFIHIKLDNASDVDEYRDPNESFYDFTEGKHIFIHDSRLGLKKCEIITGETDYTLFEEGGFEKICFGGMSPIMLYASDDSDLNKQYDKTEIRATYREIFDLVRRANEAKKPISLLVRQSDVIENVKIKDD